MEQEDSGCPQGALPLREAMWKWLPEEAMAAVRQAEEHMNRNAREVYWIGPDGKKVFGLDDSPHNHLLLQDRLAAQKAAAATFIRELRAGRLVAWGREGSPLARFRAIPPDAWAALNFIDIGGGRAGGAGVELFSLHVAAAVAPVEPAPAVPSPPEPVMTAARSEVSTGIASERRLEKWLTEAMTAEPSNPVSKPEMRQRAGREPGLSVSGRGFERAWAGAVKASGAVAWASPGRRKSPR